jgi:hypothetical protein
LRVIATGRVSAGIDIRFVIDTPDHRAAGRMLARAAAATGSRILGVYGTRHRRACPPRGLCARTRRGSGAGVLGVSAIPVSANGVSSPPARPGSSTI